MRYDEPFRHWVVKPPRFGPLATVADAARLVAADCRDSLAREGVDYRYGTQAPWKGYDGPLERKAVCTDPGEISAAAVGLFDKLAYSFVPHHLLWDTDLRPDTTWHGGGVHAMRAGDFLGCHLDYARHPKLENMERRLNLVYFLVDDWREEWGGALEFWDDSASTVVRRVYPAPGRAVLWEPSDVSYHSVQRVSDDCPRRRLTANVFFVAPARPGCVRKRALFVPNREHERAMS